MEKNWLIRTKSNHILGPISKEKMLELYRNGSIKPDDEICSGNGFWFYLRENDLVEKFLAVTDVQSFNPVSEAKDVLQIKDQKSSDHSSNDITVMANFNVKDVIQSSSMDSVNENINKDYNPDEEIPPPVLDEASEIDSKKKLIKKNGSKKSGKHQASFSSQNSQNSKSQKKQDFLKWIGVVGFVLLFCLIYFRKRIIRNFFDTETVSFSIIQNAKADELFEKKKSFFNR